MCRLYKAKSDPRLYVIVLELIIFIIYARCDTRKLDVREGEVAELNFSYPCDITEIRLQHGSNAPFYNSASPQSNTLPPRYDIVNPKSYSNQSCYLQLTINPVSRNDTGIYVLLIYKNSRPLTEYPRIVLSVSYPPGKALCELSNDYYNGGFWASLRCTAPMGTIPGQIVCYQDDIRLPSLTPQEENGETLNQTILARLAGLVYCCTSTFQQTKDKCECNDFRWNPIRNTEPSNIPDPCIAATQAAEQDSTTSSIQQDLQENSTVHPTALDPRTGRNTCASNTWLYTFVATTILLCPAALIGVCDIALRDRSYLGGRNSEQKMLSKRKSIGNEDELQVNTV